MRTQENFFFLSEAIIRKMQDLKKMNKTQENNLQVKDFKRLKVISIKK